MYTFNELYAFQELIDIDSIKKVVIRLEILALNALLCENKESLYALIYASIESNIEHDDFEAHVMLKQLDILDANLVRLSL